MPNISIHATSIPEGEERRRTFFRILLLHIIIKIICFSTNARQCNIADSVVLNNFVFKSLLFVIYYVISCRSG